MKYDEIIPRFHLLSFETSPFSEIICIFLKGGLQMSNDVLMFARGASSDKGSDRATNKPHAALRCQPCAHSWAATDAHLGPCSFTTWEISNVLSKPNYGVSLETDWGFMVSASIYVFQSWNSEHIKGFDQLFPMLLVLTCHHLILDWLSRSAKITPTVRQRTRSIWTKWQSHMHPFPTSRQCSNHSISPTSPSSEVGKNHVDSNTSI